ncbi:hypothetical protein AVEN_18245-1 [Araneus ventricosus]|uniref:Histone-lysine N-methyltransferase SETMAR n=1 Tax=Araneus ventricosus TaxID=182803 RepID=A0A4Y2AIM6_ARAVE|nr:hypothetical protein AVEN_18245-1 [Araneus ventricosus]
MFIRTEEFLQEKLQSFQDLDTRFYDGFKDLSVQNCYLPFRVPNAFRLVRWGRLERVLPAQESSLSSDRGLELRGPSQNSPRVASKRDVNVTKLKLENLVPDKSYLKFGNRKQSLVHREAIRSKRPVKLSYGVILLHDNTHTARKTQKFVQKFKLEVCSHPPFSPDLAANLDSKHLSVTRFSSNSNVKTAAENRLNGQGHDFYQAGLNKLVLSSVKYLNIEEKWSANIPLNSFSYFLLIVYK